MITIEEIVGYLPYGLKVTFEADEHVHSLVGLDTTRKGAHIISPFNDFGFTEIDKLKPLLRPLSEYIDINSDAMNELNTDLTIQIEINDLATKHIGYWNASFGAIRVMQENHIDYQDLISRGDAINLNHK